MNFKIIYALICILFVSFDADAQYFGRNKPKYNDLQFKIFETAHFSIYYYDLDSSVISKYASWFETWYEFHSNILDEKFLYRNPVVLYNNHGDFQQNYIIGGNVDVGTGGVTEGLRNRIVLPVALTNDQTFHVIGHELVHAFQYNMILRGDSLSMQSLQNYPLWIIEGLAEYLSKGRTDVHTAMWMRDAVLQNNLPPLRKLDRPEYFPYRFGQAFWSFFSGMFGDHKIKPFFLSIGRYGLQIASKDVLGIHIDTLSDLWQRTLTAHYKNQFPNTYLPGKKIITDDNSGRINISPSISPNGKYICYLSEKNLFTTDLFIADASNGKIIKKLFSSAKEGHIDNLNSLESAGTWSPDSKRFAFSAFKKGRSTLIIKNVEKGKTEEEITIKELAYFTNPSWSPDGKQILVSGLKNGQADLYLYTFKTKDLIQLTNTEYSEIHADWSPDGSLIVFSTDELAFKTKPVNGYWNYNLATLDVKTLGLSHYQFFPGANNLNPQFSSSGNIVFLSDRDGSSNIYEFIRDSGIINQLSYSRTGVSNLTPFGPAISLSGSRDRLVYSYYTGNSFQIHQMSLDKVDRFQVDSLDINQEEVILPVVNSRIEDHINNKLKELNTVRVNSDSFKIKPYKSKFALAYAGGNGGAGYGGNYLSGGVGLNGGVDLLFNDILGNHQLYTGLALNGEISDIAAAASYINRTKVLPWGASIQHQPNRFFNYVPGFTRQTFVDDRGNQFSAYSDTTEILRIFEDQIGLFTQYPLSVTQRFEIGAGTSYRFFSLERIYDFYDDINKFFYIGSQREKIPLGSSINLGNYRIEKGWLSNLNAAWVGDNSYFGLTSPMLGYRYRVGIEKYFGQYDFLASTLDGRKYYWIKPFTLAFRVLQYSRYGKDAANFYPTLLGQYGLMHGYGFNQLDELRTKHGILYEQISGSKIAMASFEFRLPLTGPKRFALLPFAFLPIELNIFLDGGVAWDDFRDFTSDLEFLQPLPVFSAGFGFRVNLFGAIVLEPYFAWPLLKNSTAEFGLNFFPGW
jgi:hypothetical protein